MTGTLPAQQSISDLLSSLSQHLDPLIAARLTGGTDNTDWTTILAELDRAKGRSRHNYSRTDLQSQLRMLTERLGGLGFPFDDSLRQVSTVANELRIMRNRWAHNDPLSDLDALRTADHVARLLTLLGDADGAAEAKTRRTELLTAYAAVHGIAAPASIPAVTPEPVSTPTPRSVPVEAPGPRTAASATATPSASQIPNPDHVSPAPADLQRTSVNGASATDTRPSVRPATSTNPGRSSRLAARRSSTPCRRRTPRCRSVPSPQRSPSSRARSA